MKKKLVIKRKAPPPKITPGAKEMRQVPPLDGKEYLIQIQRSDTTTPRVWNDWLAPGDDSDRTGFASSKDALTSMNRMVLADNGALNWRVIRVVDQVERRKRS